MADAKTRLRKTFRYPDDDDTSDRPEALDEQEQETLITTLQAQNTSSNILYTRLFLSLPALPTLLYLSPLLHRSTFLPAVLALTSLASSAWSLLALPPGKTGIAAIDALNETTAEKQTRTAGAVLNVATAGPVERYLPYLNAVLASLLMVLGAVLERRVPELVWPGFGLVPAFVYIVVLMAKFVMGGVDVGELEGLKYGYKGA